MATAINFKKSWALWLVLIITVVYAPFLGFRVVRMAGDEKVYLSQALEMAAHGQWFLQRLQGVPDYYKGPLHYLLLRIGFIVLGKNAWAALYMNFFLLIGGAISMGALVRKHCPKWNGGPIWAGSFFATCVGVYTHAFASQMEVELACLFSMGLYLLDQLEDDEPGFLFWLLMGLIGWAKSPIHALLGGVAAVLYWFLTGQLLRRLRNPLCWAAVLSGVAFCALGYLPAYLLDRENFVSIYIEREQLSKVGGSGQHWSVSLVSVLGFYLSPWLLLCVVSYAEALWNLAIARFRPYGSEARRALVMAICWVLPSFLFFAYHPYHFENYNLPVISGVIFFHCLVIAHRSPRWALAYRIALLLTAAVLIVIPCALTALAVHFQPMPAWWPSWIVPLSWVGAGSSVLSLIYFGFVDQMKKMHALAIGMIGFYLTLGSVISVIGERELVDLRAYLRNSDANGERLHRIGYYNLQQNIWSEWGFLNLWTDREFHEIHDPKELKETLLSGEPVIVPARGPLTDFRAFAEQELPGVRLKWTPWKRWRTQGRAENGDSLWSTAWKSRNLSVLEFDYFIVQR